jgi:hypothetical protein
MRESEEFQAPRVVPPDRVDSCVIIKILQDVLGSSLFNCWTILVPAF